ncbi:MAG: hypothetical protein AAGU19_01870 [Prolixibacteraceae bacterium]
MDNNSINKYLHTIALNLISHVSQHDSLLYGRMGTVIFFFHYSRYTSNRLYEDYASQLLSLIRLNLSSEIPTNYEYGLCGIGAGVGYLAQQQFIETNADEVFEDFDRLFELKLCETDLSLSDTISIGRYLLFRIGQDRKNNNLGRMSEIIVRRIRDSYSPEYYLEKIIILSGLLECQYNKEIPELLEELIDKFEISFVTDNPYKWLYVFSHLKSGQKTYDFIGEKIRKKAEDFGNEYFSNTKDYLKIAWSCASGTQCPQMSSLFFSGKFIVDNSYFNEGLAGFSGLGLAMLTWLNKNSHISWYRLL